MRRKATACYRGGCATVAIGPLALLKLLFVPMAAAIDEERGRQESIGSPAVDSFVGNVTVPRTYHAAKLGLATAAACGRHRSRDAVSGAG
jgi:hypothetical protein